MEDIIKIPSRFEGLLGSFGEVTHSILLPISKDIEEFMRISISINRTSQGKLIFLYGPSGIGKSSFLYSLPIFQPKYFTCEVKLPLAWDLELSQIPGYIAKNIPRSEKITIVTVDRRESPDFDEREFKGLMVNLNALLRDRADILVVWPVTDRAFAEQAVRSIQQAGGNSPFDGEPIINLNGLELQQYTHALENLLTLSGVTLADFAIEHSEVENFIAGNTIGGFLDNVNKLISARTDVSDLGVRLPTLVFAISSSDEPTIQGICRGLRRADKFLLEAARLKMYTKESKVIEWWNERSKDPKSALPFIITMFKAQVVSLSPSAVVYSCLLYGDEELQKLATGPQKNRANGRSTMKSSEFVRYFGGKDDAQKTGRPVSEDVASIYAKIQAVSETKHKEINKAILDLAHDTDSGLFDNYKLEQGHENVQTDAHLFKGDSLYSLEFHHKAGNVCTENKIAIYILEKLKEYSIAYGFTSR